MIAYLFDVQDLLQTSTGICSRACLQFQKALGVEYFFVDAMLKISVLYV
jgi:hypothetical protein